MVHGIAASAAPENVRGANSWTPPQNHETHSSHSGGGASFVPEPAPTHTGEETVKFLGILQTNC